MESSLQQRIIGAIVLVTLGVIFIPTLLDGAGYRSRNTYSIVVKKPPEFVSVKQIPVPFNHRNKTEAATSKQTKNTQLAIKNNQSKKDNKQPVIKKRTLKEQKVLPKKTTPKKTQAKKVELNNKTKTKTAIVKKPIKSKTSKKTKLPLSVYSLQVGTFSKLENAKKMQQKIKKLGYNSYINSDEKVNGSVSYKVRIGPDVTRDKLDKTKTKLKDKYKISAYIINHS